MCLRSDLEAGLAAVVSGSSPISPLGDARLRQPAYTQQVSKVVGAWLLQLPPRAPDGVGGMWEVGQFQDECDRATGDGYERQVLPVGG